MDPPSPPPCNLLALFGQRNSVETGFTYMDKMFQNWPANKRCIVKSCKKCAHSLGWAQNQPHVSVCILLIVSHLTYTKIYCQVK